MSDIFSRCSSLELLDLSNFNIDNVTYANYIFIDTFSFNKLKKIKVSKTQIEKFKFFSHSKSLSEKFCCD